MKGNSNKAQKVSAPSGAWYFLGMVGSLVYFVQLAHGFWPIILAGLKAPVWPAFLTFDLFKFLAR